MRAKIHRRYAPVGHARAAMFRALSVSAEAFFKAGNACLYIAAGCLRNADLRRANQIEWQNHSASIDEVDAGLTASERRFYGQFLRPGDRVLLVGCGAGRDLLGLRLEGFDVVGLEQVSSLVQAARGHLARRTMTGTVREGLIETAHIDGPYDAVIFSNGCYSFVRDSSARTAALGRIAAQLAAGGRVLFSYYPRRNSSRVGQMLTRLSARIARADWTPEPGDIFSRDNTTTGVLRYRHDFEPAAFARECGAAGLMVVYDEQTDEVVRFAAATLP